MSTKQKLSDEERMRLIAGSAARTKEGEGKSVRLDLRIYFNSDGTYAIKAPGVGDGLMARNDERLMAQLAEVIALVER
jgi:hypothetical protein